MGVMSCLSQRRNMSGTWAIWVQWMPRPRRNMSGQYGCNELPRPRRNQGNMSVMSCLGQGETCLESGQYECNELPRARRNMSGIWAIWVLCAASAKEKHVWNLGNMGVMSCLSQGETCLESGQYGCNELPRPKSSMTVATIEADEAVA